MQEYMNKLVQRIFFASLAALVLLTAAHACVSYLTDFNMSGAAGSWTALAADLKNGVFYRPLYGPLGYGGTRYFPLHFVLQAALMQCGINGINAGRLLELSSLITLIAGTVVLLRQCGVRTWLSISSALLVLGTPSAQAVVANIRGDVLPAALNILGLAVCIKERLGWRRILAASALFTLAFAAKETTIFGMAAVVASLFIQRRPSVAWKLLSITMGGYALVLGAIYFASEGRAFVIFSSCALAGGSWLSMILSGPLNIAVAAANDMPRNGVVFLILGFACLLSWNNRVSPIPRAAMISTAIVSAMIMGSPGADGNHLLDLYVISIIVLCIWIDAQSKHVFEFGICLLTAAAIFTLPEQLITIRHDVAAGRSDRHDSERVLQLVKNLHKPVLADNALLCIRAGQVPYVLDPFFFSVLNARNPSFAEPLWLKLRTQAFGSVVLDTDPQSPFGKTWFSTVDFGPHFLEELNRTYYLADQTSTEYIFLPREH